MHNIISHNLFAAFIISEDFLWVDFINYYKLLFHSAERLLKAQFSLSREFIKGSWFWHFCCVDFITKKTTIISTVTTTLKVWLLPLNMRRTLSLDFKSSVCSTLCSLDSQHDRHVNSNNCTHLFLWLLMSHFSGSPCLLFSACWDRFSRDTNLETPWQNYNCYLSWHGGADSFTSYNQILWFKLLSLFL